MEMIKIIPKCYYFGENVNLKHMKHGSMTRLLHCENKYILKKILVKISQRSCQINQTSVRHWNFLQKLK
jgi:hypothetical protein